MQGARWRRLDNTAKIFPGITNEDLSNVFRVSMVLKEDVDPELLGEALERVLPALEGFRVKLRRGFFWYYFETNRRTPKVDREAVCHCRYIDPHSHQLFLFRVSYFERKINLEVFHALTDGLGGVNFLKALVCEYLRLKRESREQRPGQNKAEASHMYRIRGRKAGRAGKKKKYAADAGAFADAPPHDVEDSYKKHYRKIKRRKYATAEAFQLDGEVLPLDVCSVVHGTMDAEALRAAARARGVSMTKYLTAMLIWSVFQEYETGNLPVGINLPVNLRGMFASETGANFFAVTLITCRRSQCPDFDTLLASVSRQMDENLRRENLEETISYNVSNEQNLLVRLVPLPLKGIGVRAIFAKSSRAYTVTLSNLGVIDLPGEWEQEVESAHGIIGVSRQQPFKCVVATCRGRMTVTFASVFRNLRIQRRFFACLKEQGIEAELTSNGIPEDAPERGMYPEISADERTIRRAEVIFRTVMLCIAVFLVAVNAATYRRSGLWWSFIAVGGMAYVELTVRYSILKSRNLAGKLVAQSLGMQALLIAIDWVTGYRGWAVNYAIPGVILFDVTAVAALMAFNRLNWQSYFMYQLALTLFGFMPLVMFLAGWVTRPTLAVITAAVSAALLLLTVILGDRSVKNELVRRFHI